MAFGYVIVGDDFRVKDIIHNCDFEKYKIVEDGEYEIGDIYPRPNLEEYGIVGVKFVNGVNDKIYVFRDYTYGIGEGEHVLVDTVYGPQLAKVVEVYTKNQWHGVEPTKDVISSLPDYDDYAERKASRKRAEEKKKAENETKEKYDEFINLLTEVLPIFGEILKDVD